MLCTGGSSPCQCHCCKGLEARPPPGLPSVLCSARPPAVELRGAGRCALPAPMGAETTRPATKQRGSRLLTAQQTKLQTQL